MEDTGGQICNQLFDLEQDIQPLHAQVPNGDNGLVDFKVPTSTIINTTGRGREGRPINSKGSSLKSGLP